MRQVTGKYVLVAVAILLSLVATVVIAEALDPIPPSLRDRVHFGADGLTIKGSLTGEEWRLISNLFFKPPSSPPDPFSHWSVDRTKGYPTASYVYVDVSPPLVSSGFVPPPTNAMGKVILGVLRLMWDDTWEALHQLWGGMRVVTDFFFMGANAQENWYARDTAGALTCGSDLNKAASETQGTGPLATHVLTATYDYWYADAGPKSIGAGNWTVTFWTTTSGEGGPAGKATVIVERVNSSCVVQQTIITEEIGMTKGATQSYTTTPVDPGVVTVATGEYILYRFAMTSGTRTITLRYDWNDANSANTRLVHPLTQVTCGSNRYWVGGTGNWSATTSWADASGAASGCDPPTASNPVFFDAASGAGTATVDVNAVMASLDTTGNSISTIAVQTFNFAVSGNVTHAAGTITIGISAGTGVTATGGLTLSGTASIQMGTSAAIGDIDGNVNISSVGAFIDFGSGSWSFGGTWTNSTTSASWDAGTGTATFDAAVAGTMTFAGSNLAEDEFFNVTFTSSAGTAQVFTLATRGLRWGGTLSITDTVLTTELATAGLTLTGGTLSVGNAGILTANASSATLTSVTMTGGTSGTITLTTASWAVNGSWNTSGAGSTFTEGTSAVTMGATGSINMLATDNDFNNLTVSAGTVTLAATIDILATLTISGGVLAKSTFGFTVVTLDLTGGDITSTSGNVTVSGNASISSAASAIDWGSETWTFYGDWSNSSTDTTGWDAGTGTATFASSIGGTMTFAGTNLAEDEFNVVAFSSSAGTPQVFTMATRGLRASTVNINDAGSTTALNTSVGNLAITAGTLALGAGGILTANGSTITVTSIDTSAGTYTVGTSLVVISASGGSVNIDETANNLTVNSGISTTFAASFTWADTLTMTSATVGFGPSSLTSSGAATITFASATITMSTGSWDTSSASSFISTGSSVTFSGTAALSIAIGHAFATVEISAGTRGVDSQLTVASLTLSGGILNKKSNTLTVNGGLTMSGGDLTGLSGDVIITGAVNISSALSAIDFGSETWTVSGTWTNASTDAAGWDAGTGTVLFDSSIGGTMTFASVILAEDEFNHLTLNSFAGTPQTFTMSTNSLRIAGTLTVTDSTSTTTLDTTNLNIQANIVDVLTNGIILMGTGDFIGLVTFNIDGSLTMDTIVVGNMYINRNVGSGTIDITLWTAWAVGADVDVRWTFSPSVTGDTWDFVLEDVMASTSYDLLRSAIVIDTQTSVGTVVTLSGIAGWSAGDAMSIDETPTICGAARFWVNGTGNWSSTAQWSDSSGGASGCAVPTSANAVTVDAASSVAAMTITIDVNATMASFTTTGFNDAGSTLAIGTFNFAVSGNITYDTGNLAITIGISATNGLTATGTLTMTGGASIVMTGASVGDIDGAVSIDATSFIDFGSGTWNFGGTWTNNTTSASWDAGTGTTTFDAAVAGTMTFAGANLSEAEFNSVTFTSSAGAAQTFTMATRGLRWLTTLTISDTVSTTALATTDLALGAAADVADLVMGNGGILTANASTVLVNGVTMTGGTSGVITVTTGAWTVSGNWNTSGAGSIYTQGTGIVTFDATATITLLSTDNTFDDLTISAGTITLATDVVVTNALIISGGTLAKSTFTVNMASLTMSGGDLTSTSGNVVITGAINISSTASAIDFGSETWTVSGAFDCASTDTAVWEAGTGTITFDSATGDASFTPCAITTEAHFNNATFSSTGGTAQVFTLVTSNLRWAGTLTVSDSVSTTELVTTDLALVGGGLTMGNGGILTANASAVTVASVTMTGGTSGVITVTTGAWTVSGNWDTSGAGSVYTQGTGIVTFDATATITLLATDNTFDDLTISAGTVTLTTAVIVTNVLTLSGGTFAKATFAITSAGSLTMSGGDLTSTSGDVAITGAVNISSAASAIDFGSENWTVSGTWTNASTDAAGWDAGTGTVTFDSAVGGSMTFAGTNLSENEFNTVTFESSAGTAQTFTMSTRGLRAANITISDGSLTTTLDTTVGNLALTASVTLTVGSGGILTANGSTLTVQSIDTSVGTYTVGTSAVVVNTSGGTINIDETANSLTVNSGISTTFSASFTWSGTLTFTSATIAFGASSLTASGTPTMTFASATITMSTGSWDTSVATTFTSTSSSVTFSGTGSLTIAAGHSFGSVVISGGTRTLGSQLTATGLTISGGTLAKNTRTLTVNGNLTMSGGDLTSTSGTAVVTGNVDINNVASAIDFGSEAWTVSGTWSNASTDGAVWDAGTGSMLFDSATGGTMVFAGTNLSEAEFNSVTFTSSVGTPQTFTMATRGLRWLTTLSITDSTSTTTLATADLALGAAADTPDISIGNSGILTANASTVIISTFTMTGGVSGTLTITTGAWTVSGNWNSSGAGSTFAQGTGIHTFDATATITLLSTDNTFDDLTISAGTATMASAIVVTNTLTVTGTLATANLALTTGPISIGNAGVLTANASTVIATSVTMTGGVSGTITVTTGAWTVSGNWNTGGVGSIYTQGTGIVTFDATATITLLASDNTFDDLTISAGTSTMASAVVVTNTLTVTGTLATANLALTTGPISISNAGVLTANASTVIATSVTMTGGVSGTITVTTGAWTVSGNWNTSGAGSTFTQGTGTVTMSGAGTTITLLSTDNDFNNLTISASGTVTLASSMDVLGTLTVNSGAVLALSTFVVLITTLAALAGGITAGASGSKTVSSNVTVNTTGFFSLGGTSWEFQGTWTNNSTSVSWDAGTGTTTFSSATAGTMTFGGANLGENEFFNATFESSAGTAQTFTMATRALQIGGTLAIQDALSTTTFDTSVGNLAITAPTVTLTSAGGILTANGSTITVTSFNSVGGAYTVGTSIVVVNISSGTISIDETANSLTVNSGISTTFGNTLTWSGTLTLSGATATFGASNLTSSGVAVLTTDGTTSITMSTGSWDTSSIATLTVSGTTEFSDTGTVNLSAGSTFSTLTVSGGTRTQSSQLTATSLTISGGTLAKSTFTLTISSTATALTMSGGDLTSTSGAVVISGDVNISSAASAIDFGSETWTVSGTWTNATTDAVGWDAGTGTVTFDSATGGTMTFAGVNIAEAEFNHLTFNSSAGTAQTFTMVTRSLRIVGTLTITDSTSTTTLDTANLNIQANIVDVLTNGIILVGTGDFIGLVTFNIDGSLTMDTIVVGNMYMNRTAGTGTVDITLWTAWAVGADVDVRWTFSPSVAGDTWQFVLEDVGVSASYDLIRNSIVIDTQTSVGTVVTLSEAAGWAAGDAMAIDESSVCGTGSRFWVLGTGNWNDTAHWSDTSGGTSGCSVPVSTDTVTIDASSGSGTYTVNVNAVMVSFNTTGMTGTLAVGTFNFAVGGSITHAGGTITIGISATAGLTATGSLTISGTASIQAGASAEVVDIDGAVNVSSPTAFIDFGSGTWSVGGTWTNSTTSASWDAGTGTITFDSVTGGTMTFAGVNLAEAEFNSVTFTSSAGAAQTFTMATRGLRWLTTLMVSDSTSTTALATADLTLGATADAAGIVVGNGGILTANASTVIINAFTMTGGVSGTLTITTGAWTVSGNWNTSGAGSTYTQGTGIVTFDATSTITMLPTDNTFDDLTISGGTVTLATTIVVTNRITVSGGTFDTATLDITVDEVVLNSPGTMYLSGDVLGFTRFEMNVSYTHDGITTSVTFTLTVDIGTVDLTQMTSGSADEVTWNLNPSDTGATLTAIMGGLTANTVYDMLRSDTIVQTLMTDADGNVTFAVTGGWSPHSVSIQAQGVGGGGGGGGDRDITVPNYRPLIMFVTAAIFLLVIISIASRGVKMRRRRRR